MSQSIDRARLTLILNDPRLSAIKQDWARLAKAMPAKGSAVPLLARRGWGMAGGVPAAKPLE
jgi:hypothetical protein